MVISFVVSFFLPNVWLTSGRMEFGRVLHILYSIGSHDIMPILSPSLVSGWQYLYYFKLLQITKLECAVGALVIDFSFLLSVHMQL